MTLEVLDDDGAVRTHADRSPVTVAQILREWQVNDPAKSRCYDDPIAWNMLVKARGKNGNGKK